MKFCNVSFQDTRERSWGDSSVLFPKWRFCSSGRNAIIVNMISVCGFERYFRSRIAVVREISTTRREAIRISDGDFSITPGNYVTIIGFISQGCFKASEVVIYNVLNGTYVDFYRPQRVTIRNQMYHTIEKVLLRFVSRLTCPSGTAYFLCSNFFNSFSDQRIVIFRMFCSYHACRYFNRSGEPLSVNLTHRLFTGHDVGLFSTYTRRFQIRICR